MNHTLIPFLIVAQSREYSLCRLAFWRDNHKSHLSIDRDQWLVYNDLATFHISVYMTMPVSWQLTLGIYP